MRTVHKHQRGDSILEVLLAIVVISVILAGAFGVTRRSSQAVRGSQEQTQATKIVESQLEQLRSAVIASDPANNPTTSNNFCMADGQVTAVSSSTCRFDQSNEAYTSGSVRYDVRIQRASNLYTLTATWESIRGNTAQEVMYYRAYAP